MSEASSTRQRFESATDELIADVRQDPNILAAILCGSLSHDEVWDRSDIDLVLVSVDDKKMEQRHIALVKDNINIHTTIMTRGEFRTGLESATRNTFEHSLFAKATLLFSDDPSIDRLFAGINVLGERDKQIQQMIAGAHALAPLYKAQKWWAIKSDLDYTALWLLHTATAIAQIELGAAGRIVAREVLPDASELNPELFKVIYADLLNRKKTRKAVGTALKTIEQYLLDRTQSLFAPILEYLKVAGDPRSMTEIHAYFTRNYGFDEALIACEWLSDTGFIEKASTPVKLTVKSRVDIEELAFYKPDF